MGETGNVEALLASVHSTAGLGTWLGPPRPESRVLVTLRVVEGLARRLCTK